MKAFWILAIIFGIVIIIFPAILVFLIGGFFIFLGVNILLFFGILKGKKEGKEDYIKFGKYKIYR